MAKVRLTKPGMNTYSSYFGTVKFKDGVSEDHVSSAEIRLLGAITAIEVIEEDGSARQGGAASEMVEKRNAPITSEKPIVPDATEVSAPAEVLPKPVEIEEGQVGTKEPDQADELDDVEAELEAAVEQSEGNAAPAKTYTEEELAEIADDKGIVGLREIAEPLGAKSNSIAGLITAILTAQSRQGQ